MAPMMVTCKGIAKKVIAHYKEESTNFPVGTWLGQKVISLMIPSRIQLPTTVTILWN